MKRETRVVVSVILIMLGIISGLLSVFSIFDWTYQMHQWWSSLLIGITIEMLFFIAIIRHTFEESMEDD